MVDTRRHTTASRWAAATVILLGLLQGWWSDLIRSGGGLNAATVLFPVTIASGVLLLRANCFETRLLAVVACAAQLGLTVLALTVGLPGGGRHSVDLRTVAGLALPVVALALIGLDRRARGASSPG